MEAHIELERGGEKFPAFLKRVTEIAAEVPLASQAGAEVILTDGPAGRFLTVTWTPPARCDKTQDMFG